MHAASRCVHTEALGELNLIYFFLYYFFYYTRSGNHFSDRATWCLEVSTTMFFGVARGGESLAGGTSRHPLISHP